MTIGARPHTCDISNFVLTPTDGLGCVRFICSALHCFWCLEVGSSSIDGGQLGKLFT
jgi:hypothetical protein